MTLIETVMVFIHKALYIAEVFFWSILIARGWVVKVRVSM